MAFYLLLGFVTSSLIIQLTEAKQIGTNVCYICEYRNGVNAEDSCITQPWKSDSLACNSACVIVREEAKETGEIRTFRRTCEDVKQEKSYCVDAGDFSTCYSVCTGHKCNNGDGETMAGHSPLTYFVHSDNDTVGNDTWPDFNVTDIPPWNQTAPDFNLTTTAPDNSTNSSSVVCVSGHRGCDILCGFEPHCVNHIHTQTYCCVLFTPIHADIHLPDFMDADDVVNIVQGDQWKTKCLCRGISVYYIGGYTETCMCNIT